MEPDPVSAHSMDRLASALADAGRRLLVPLADSRGSNVASVASTRREVERE